MAHNFRVKVVPHKNKDGTAAKKKKDYVVIDRSRSGSRQVGVASTRKAADGLIAMERDRLVQVHSMAHPNDRAFHNKLAEFFGIGEDK